MFKPDASFQSSMFGAFAYRGILARHQDHFLVRLRNAVDFSFVLPLVEDCYAALGRPAYHPVIMMKLLLLQTLYDLSERDVVEQADANILFRAFLGLSLDDAVPHWTLVGKFRERLGEQRFAAIFNQVVLLAQDVGLLDTKLRILDSTAVKAKVDVARHVGTRADDDDAAPDRLERRSPDPEARTGHKTAHRRWYGYKHHTSLDPASDIVTAVATTPANVSDVTVALELIDHERRLFAGEPRPIRRVTGDNGAPSTPELTVVALGPIVLNALATEAADVDWFTVSQLPLTELSHELVQSVEKTERVLVLEEHVERGGLAEHLALLLLKEGLGPRFESRSARGYPSGKYGSQAWHQKESGLDAASLGALIRELTAS